jgi:hypothetical protein
MFSCREDLWDMESCSDTELRAWVNVWSLRLRPRPSAALEEGDLRPDQVKLIAKRLGVTEQDVVNMNRRLGGDVSLNAPIRDDGDSGEWQDWLVDEVSDQETRLVEDEESDNRRKPRNAAIMRTTVVTRCGMCGLQCAGS